MKEKLRQNKWGIYTGVVAVLLLIFATKDLEISKAMYNKQSSWSKFFEIFGEHPPMVIALIGASILFRIRDTKHVVTNILVSGGTLILSAISVLGLWVLTASRLFEQKIGIDMMIPGLIFGIIVTLIIQIMLNKVSRKKLFKYKRAALISVLIVLFAVVVINVIKPFWGRVRFRDMLDDFSKFTPWYLPQGNTGHQSFPSGHSANSWTFIVLTLYVAKENIKIYKATWIFTITWGLLVGISRIVLGAHFASDVTVGAVITIGGFLLLTSIIKDTSLNKTRVDKIEVTN